ncbi:PREDICTED: putative F-box/LRR-repeat protein 19 [Brassica oleracea var. oleracea]|uniref:putative F-box/LRR-repeat protein 19 n=1 Tax=Brassica oleracea var. oleracea TaxID=109376 RepID=UPI0006A6EAF0|nr:PREDICTED: putative F-box/LRR-repeat protein 19 [Brassica oleracea var. oleracea]
MGSRLHHDWSELAPECLLDIFSRLSMGQRWNGPMLVCKTWMNLCQDPSFNTVLDLEAEFLSSPESFYWWSPEFEEKVDSTIRSAVDQSQGSLTEVRVRHCTDKSLSYVAERCPNLEILWVKYCPKVTDVSMRKIALNCPKLKELDVSCSFKICCACMKMVGTNCKNLQILKRNSMQPSEVKRLRHCTYVQYLSFEYHGDIEADTIVRHMSQLKHLELRLFSTLTDSAIVDLCEGCSNLEYLDLFGCGRLTSKGVTKAISKLKNLKVIKKPDFDVLGEALGMDVEIDLEWLNKLFEEYDGVEHNG